MSAPLSCFCRVCIILTLILNSLVRLIISFKTFFFVLKDHVALIRDIEVVASIEEEVAHGHVPDQGKFNSS